MNQLFPLLVVAVVQVVWLGLQWRRHGFLSALNLFAYGAFMVLAGMLASGEL